VTTIPFDEIPGLGPWPEAVPPARFNRGTLGDLLGPDLEIPDGRVDIKVERVNLTGSRIRIEVSSAAGGLAEIPLGQKASGTLTKNVRVLLGHSDLAGYEELRTELEGKTFRVRLGTQEYRGHVYRTIGRA
jgi:hypothetical protein